MGRGAAKDGAGGRDPHPSLPAERLSCRRRVRFFEIVGEPVEVVLGAGVAFALARPRPLEHFGGPVAILELEVRLVLAEVARRVAAPGVDDSDFQARLGEPFRGPAAEAPDPITMTSKWSCALAFTRPPPRFPLREGNAEGAYVTNTSIPSPSRARLSREMRDDVIDPGRRRAIRQLAMSAGGVLMFPWRPGIRFSIISATRPRSRWPMRMPAPATMFPVRPASARHRSLLAERIVPGSTKANSAPFIDQLLAVAPERISGGSCRRSVPSSSSRSGAPGRRGPSCPKRSRRSC